MRLMRPVACRLATGERGRTVESLRRSLEAGARASEDGSPEPTEREGFEPSDEVDPRHTISSRARSAAPAPLLDERDRLARLRSATLRRPAPERARRRP